MKIPSSCDIHRKQHYRSIFLSDFHIGAKSCDSRSILDFLRRTESDYLYLVGDIIDGWKMNKRWYWTNDYSQIFDELARKVSEGTKVIYITGNHDEEVRLISALRRMRFSKKMKIEIRNKTTHMTNAGKNFLIIHGDQFDRQILRGRISRLFDRIYDRTMEWIEGSSSPDVVINGRVKRFSLAKALKRGGKIALYLLNNFEKALYSEAKRHNVDGVICGHTHIPVLKPIKNIIYANCGAWLKNTPSAIVETINGSIEIIEWKRHAPPDQKQYSFHLGDKPKTINIIPSSYAFRPVTDRIVKSLIRIWHPDRKDHNPLMQWTQDLWGTLKTSYTPSVLIKSIENKKRILSDETNRHITFAPKRLKDHKETI